ncbi:MAG: hypothetical protein DRO01_01005 [Thermoproteota archaeon]|nr:MAG: hypothetical protein DRO01_01005 [Candidatus Korarchaeota archaeon]
MGEEVDRIRAKLEKLDDALLEGRISEETYRELKEKYERRLKELQSEIGAGAAREPARAEPSEAAGLPPGVQETLSPAALAFVFDDELFGLTGLQENLFKFNRANVQVALMAAATLLSLEADGHVEIRPGVRGRILKSKTVMAVKRRPFDPREYGVLSEKIHQAPVGAEVSVYDLIYEKSLADKLENPAGYVVDRVLKGDLTPQTYDFLFYWEERELKRSLVDRMLGLPKSVSVMRMHVENAQRYRGQLEELRELFSRAAREKPGFFNRVFEECQSALYAMRAAEGF